MMRSFLHAKCIPSAALLAAIAIVLSACKGDSESQRTTGTGDAESTEETATITVGFSQIGAESAWRTAETQSIREEADKRDIDLKFSDANKEQADQIAALRTFIAQDVDAIILAPKEETGWEPILREVKAAGIPVILVDRGIEVEDESLYVTLIASDFIEEGRMAGQWLAKATEGRANIVELTGTTGSAPANDRAAGFREALTAYPDMQIIRSQTGDFERAMGKQVMEAFLKSDGDRIDALYAHNDDMALGAIMAIQEAGLKPGEDILIVSIDAVHDAFVALIKGTLNATVECNPLLGPQAFDAVEAALQGATVPKWIRVEDLLFEQDDAEAVLPTRKY